MNGLSHARAARLGRHAQGFSLIELGIVIAVIAVLASVVIFGRGFIVAGRVSKTVEAVNTVRKGASTYAGLTGGTIVTAIPANLGLTRLRERQLVPPDQTQNNSRPWCVASCEANGGTGADSFYIDQIGLGQLRGQNNQGNQNGVAIRIVTPGVAQAQDLYNSVLQDPNFGNGASPGTGSGALTMACAGSLPTQGTVILCFYL